MFFFWVSFYRWLSWSSAFSRLIWIFPHFLSLFHFFLYFFFFLLKASLDVVDLFLDETLPKNCLKRILICLFDFWCSKSQILLLLILLILFVPDPIPISLYHCCPFFFFLILFSLSLWFSFIHDTLHLPLIVFLLFIFCHLDFLWSWFLSQETTTTSQRKEYWHFPVSFSHLLWAMTSKVHFVHPFP